jgi:hypothetical protein
MGQAPREQLNFPRDTATCPEPVHFFQQVAKGNRQLSDRRQEMKSTPKESRNWRIATVTGCCLALSWAATDISAAEFHITPEGRPEGDGSRERPWDLATALAHPQAVQPGDTLWLHGGRYRDTVTSRMIGTAEKPIIVRQAPGERAILDASASGSRATTLAVEGQHTWFRGFEITNSASRRVTVEGGSHPSDLPLNGSVDIYSGSGHKLINLVIHHCAAGPNAWSSARDTEVYGCLVYNNGWDAPDRGHGHAFYWQNEAGTKRLVDNIYFNQFGHGIHFYGSSRATLNNFHVEGNIGFNNGALSKRSGYSRNLLIGGGRRAEGITILDNLFYYSKGGSNVVGYGRGADRVTVTGNHFLSAEGVALQLQAESLTLSRNTFLGNLEGIRSEDYSDNQFFGSQRPGGVTVMVRPNRYEPGRANIAVLNWDAQPSVELDFSMTGLKRGDRFDVRDAQNFFGEPVTSGRFQETPVTVPLTEFSVAPPVGDMPLEPPHTAPEFVALIVLSSINDDK